jgi:mRNA interferase MazF
VPIPRQSDPRRGEVWLADLNPIRGREQAGRRPILVVSVDAFNRSRADLVAVIPLTTTLRGIPFHVGVAPPEGGLSNPSELLCEAVRSISKERLIERWGSISAETQTAVDDRLRILFGL